jgi:hypothetical protein
MSGQNSTQASVHTLVVCSASLLLSACGEGGRLPEVQPGTADAGFPTSGEVVVGIAEEAFPSSSLADWVSYSVKVCSVTVIEEEEIPPPETVYQRREGYIGRRIRVRVDGTLWVSDGAVTPGIDRSADTLAIVVGGWVVRNGVRYRFALERSPRLEVGGAYILPLTTLLRPVSPTSPSGPALEAQWGPLSVATVIANSSSPIALGDVADRGQSSFAAELSKLPVEALAAELNRTEPHPAAKMFWHLPPSERWRAVTSSAP